MWSFLWLYLQYRYRYNTCHHLCFSWKSYSNLYPFACWFSQCCLIPNFYCSVQSCFAFLSFLFPSLIKRGNFPVACNTFSKYIPVPNWHSLAMLDFLCFSFHIEFDLDHRGPRHALASVRLDSVLSLDSALTGYTHLPHQHWQWKPMRKQFDKPLACYVV